MDRTIVTGKEESGFTLIEILVVLVLLSLLTAIVAPSATHGIDKAKESALREDLFVLRKAIDDFYADHGQYPPNLNVLVDAKFIRALPRDPVTEEKNKGWRSVLTEDGEGVEDVHSYSERKGSNGQKYSDW